VKKFEFRLASVLRLRDSQLLIEKNKLQQLFAERARLEKNLASIAEERKESAAWIQGASDTTSGDLRALAAFLLGSQARDSTTRGAIENANVHIVKQRQQVLLAERNQKLLLKLKDKRRAEWQQEFDKELEMVAQEAWQSAARSRQSH
jgi:flagellar export protein FliJ